MTEPAEVEGPPLAEVLAWRPSSPVASLDEALLIVQAHRPKVIKKKLADVTTKQGPGYSYTYADLVEVSDAVLPLLSELGVLWQTTVDVEVGPQGDQFRPVLRWRLKHLASDTHDSGIYPLRGESPQAIGGHITFARRYCLVAACGLTPEDDDDALAAEAERAAAAAAGRGAARRSDADRRRPAPSGGTAKREASSRPASARPPLRGEARPITDPQVQKIRLSLDEFGVTERADKIALVSQLIGRSVESSTQLNSREASRVIDDIEAARQQPDPGGALWQTAMARVAEQAAQEPSPSGEEPTSDA